MDTSTILNTQSMPRAQTRTTALLCTISHRLTRSAPPAPPSLALSNAQKGNGRKKKRNSSTSMAPMVPQPLGNLAPVPTMSPALPQSALVPPGHKWVLIADGAHPTIPPAPALLATPEPVSIEAEPVKVHVDLKTAQAAADRFNT